ncbi:MAG: B12-binding domain-containing radical SAM protein [Deltaproteobacteria bacterium]|nr:B12-binding domain-containing radical SAM protein [Deltaproteobacteria bacterium]
MNSIDIALIQPKQNENATFDKPIENLGMGFLSSFLKNEGFKTDIVYEELEKDLDVALDQIISRKPLVIGLAVITYYYHINIKQVAKKIRRKGYNGYIVVGGHGASFFADTILENDHNIDFVAVGLAELPLKEILVLCKKGRHSEIFNIDSLAYRKNNTIKHNPINKSLSIKKTPMPDRCYLKKYDDVYEKMIFAISASRGCFGKCKFCSIGNFYRIYSNQIWEHRDINMIIDEVVFLYNQNIRNFIFVDDEFFGNKDNTELRIDELCSKLKEKNMNISFAISCRVDSINKNMLLKLKKVGLNHIFLGVEFFTKEELQLYNKQTTIIDSVQAIKTIKSIGLSLQCGFIMFHPYTSLINIKKNLEMSMPLT